MKDLGAAGQPRRVSDSKLTSLLLPSLSPFFQPSTLHHHHQPIHHLLLFPPTFLSPLQPYPSRLLINLKPRLSRSLLLLLQPTEMVRSLPPTSKIPRKSRSSLLPHPLPFIPTSPSEPRKWVSPESTESDTELRSERPSRRWRSGSTEHTPVISVERYASLPPVCVGLEVVG